jgi:hypothetical protein
MDAEIRTFDDYLTATAKLIVGLNVALKGPFPLVGKASWPAKAS